MCANKKEDKNEKLCITAQGTTLDASVDPRFGRCQYFIIYDLATGTFDAVENGSLQAQGGAGIQAGQTVIAKGSTVVLTGNVGPNAHQVLSAAGVRIFIGVSGKVSEAIENYKHGKYKETAGPSVGSKFGMPNT